MWPSGLRMRGMRGEKLAGIGRPHFSLRVGMIEAFQFHVSYPSSSAMAVSTALPNLRQTY